MEIWLAIFMPIFVLIIEYFIVQPMIRSRGIEIGGLNVRSVWDQSSADRLEINSEHSMDAMAEVFRILSLLLISASSAILAPVILRYFSKLYNETGATDALSAFTDIIANSNITFILMALVSVAAGVGLTLFLLYKSEISNFMLQVLAAIVFGFGGGLLIWPILTLGFIILFFGLMLYYLFTYRGTKE